MMVSLFKRNMFGMPLLGSNVLNDAKLIAAFTASWYTRLKSSRTGLDDHYLPLLEAMEQWCKCVHLSHTHYRIVGR